MSLFGGTSNLFDGLGKALVDRVLPPSRLDPAAILSRWLAPKATSPGSWQPSMPGNGLDVLSAARGRGDPLLNFNWYCELPVLSSNVNLGWEFVEGATLPLIEFETQSNYRAGKMRHYPGHYSIGSLNLKIYENSGGTATRYLQHWQSMIQDPSTGIYFHPVDFKKPIKFTIFDVAKMTVMFLTYIDCWPLRADPYDFASDASNRVNPSWEFSCDDVVVTFGRYEQKDLPSIYDNVAKAESVPQSVQILKQAAQLITDRLPFNPFTF